MIALFVARLVALSRRHAAPLAIALLLLAAAGGLYAATHLRIDSDVENMLPASLPWRQLDIALNRAFPQNLNLLAIVIDGRTAELADSAAHEIAQRLRADPNLFRTVVRPDGGAFFDENGLLFMPVEALQAMSQQLVAAQPLIGSLAQDPSLRGLFATLALFVHGATSGATPLKTIDPTLASIAKIVEEVVAGGTPSLSWQRMLTGRVAGARELRRFVLTQPVLDYNSLEPGQRATDAVRAIARTLKLDPATGVRVRITGDVALNDQQFATLSEGAARSTILSIVAVVTILFLALRSLRLVGAILLTLTAGLLLTGAFAALAIGSLNVISVACAVLFIGLAVDFSIQFSVRYRDQRYRLGDFAGALGATGQSIGSALVLAAGATAIGFLSFLPTDYQGIREFGVISGAGMLIAITLNFTLLPALLTLFRPPGEPEAIGFGWASALDRMLERRRLWVIGGAGLVALASLALLPHLSFDFNPLDLNDPRSEAVATVFSLMKNPATTPYTAEVLAPSLPAAEALATRLAALPQVDQVITAATFIPAQQKKKLAIVSDLALLIGPTLSPAKTEPAPSEADVLKAIQSCRTALLKAAPTSGPAARLAAALGAALKEGPEVVEPLRRALLAGLLHQFGTLRTLLQAKPVTLASLPPELRRSWIAPDGTARVEAFPRGDARSNTVLRDFVAAVRRVAPDATGTPIAIEASGETISDAFIEAGIIALVAITILLAIVLRRVRDVLLVIAPLLLAALLTLATTVVIAMPLNYANIIALPLLLGIGVAFDIYFVMNWRAGMTNPLQSSTARAVLFSALTTMTAFGSLTWSNYPGTSDMGELLSISLAFTLVCTLFVLPALLACAPSRRDQTGLPPASP